MATAMERTVTPGHIWDSSTGPGRQEQDQIASPPLSPSSDPSLTIQTMMNKGEIPKALEQEVEQVIRKMQMLLSESKQQDESAVSSGSSSQGSTTPRSDQSGSPKATSSKPYQATVEDEGDEEAHSPGAQKANNQAGSHTQDPRASQPAPRSSSLISIASSSSASSQASLSSTSNRNSVLKDTSLPTPPSSPTTSHRKSVHFSPRSSPRIYQSRNSRGGPGSPEATTTTLTIPEIRHPQNTSRPRTPQDGDHKYPELSAVDLKWGKLFTSNGLPTKRLDQVLHGVANYLVTHFEPKHSLVVLPNKLHMLYTKYKIEEEILPFSALFECRADADLVSLQLLYQELKCEYYLVPARLGATPTIPALTPAGFADWMTLFIMACPDQEAIRLGKVVERLPIESPDFAVDGTPERLPKQLSRHLLREKPCDQAKQIALRALLVAEERSQEWKASRRTSATSLLEVPGSSSRGDKPYYGRGDRRRDVPSDRSDDTDGPSRQRPKYRSGTSRNDEPYEDVPTRRPSNRLSRRRDSSPAFGSRRPSREDRERPTSSRVHRNSFPSDRPSDDYRGSNTHSPVPSPSTLAPPPRSFPSRQSSLTGASREERLSWQDLSQDNRRGYRSSRREDDYRYYPGPGGDLSSGAEDLPPRSPIEGGGGVRRIRTRHGPTYEEYSREDPRQSREL